MSARNINNKTKIFKEIKKNGIRKKTNKRKTYSRRFY